MSADASYNILQSHADGHVALPQPIGDLSLIDSVTGFIQEAYVNVLPAETKLGDRILWAKFVPCEASPDVDTAPLILVLAYSTGVQAWSINSSGEAKEVLSWHQGIVKAFQFLPCPSPPPSSSQCTGRDMYMLKRPLVVLCDNGGPSPPFHNVTFLSLATGEQVKHIKFKNEVCEILANKKCILVTFSEKIAIFDACSLEDKFTITTCYPSPGIKCNPVSLGSRWLAFADARILSLCRSYGGYEGEGAVSYTASVLQAAKSLSKGLRELSGSVAHSLTGSGHNVSMDVLQDGLCPGIVTVLDIESKPGETRKEGSIVAHFVAHTTPIVALSFDPTGLLLLTVEKRGHKFNLFKIEPSKSGSSHAYVHHLYILHRGDTTARVQDITFSSDSRWVAVSSLRGTTHVFPITMYGGGIGLRTHTTPHVVNRLSRFHKSAGITPLTPSPPNTKSPPPNVSSSPELSSSPSFSSLSYLSPTTPLVLAPLAQIRRQLSNSTTNNSGLSHRQHATDDNTISVKVAACFSSPKCSSVHPVPHTNHIVNKVTRKSAAPSLFLITGHGYLIQYDLEPRPIAGLTKDKLCDDTPVDLHVEPRCQWRLFYPPTAEKISRVHSDLTESLIPRPLAPSNQHHDKWLSQVEIITHAGPHRRLWMGPQFSFKTYTPPSSGEFSFDNIVTSNVNTMPTRSTPMNIEKSKSVPVLIETVSTGSSDQSPRFMEEMEGEWGERNPHLMGDSQLCEDLADAMQETHSATSAATQGVSGSNRVVWVTEKTNMDMREDRPEQKSEPSQVNVNEKKVEVLCRINLERPPLAVYVKNPEDVSEKKEDKKEKIEEQVGEKETEHGLNIVDDLFSVEDESDMKRNRKTKKKENQKEMRDSREEKEAVKSKDEKKSKEEMISFDDFVELKSESKVMEEEINSSGESKKKLRKPKKMKEVEVAADTVEKIGDVDESLFEENIDIEVEKTDKESKGSEKEKERKLSVEINDTHIVEENRYESIEPENLYDDIEIGDDRYGIIEAEDRYEETYDDLEPGYQYEEEFDPYDEDLVEDVGNVYIQDELSERLADPPLISEFPVIQSFERPRTPTSGLVDSGIVDSGCGLKKRKNKKKKR